MDDSKYVVVKQATKVTGFSLTTMGFITWLVFLILKVTGVWTSISWFWVFFPLWICPAASIAGCILLFIIGVFAAIYISGRLDDDNY